MRAFLSLRRKDPNARCRRRNTGDRLPAPISPEVTRTVTRDGSTAPRIPVGCAKSLESQSRRRVQATFARSSCPVPRDSGLKSAQTSQTRVVEYFPLASRPASGLANLLSWE